MPLTRENIKKLFADAADNKELLEDLYEYHRDLDILCENEISIQFNNKGKNHAAMVMSKIFESAHNHVKIFARDFKGEISDNELYVRSLTKFLEKDDSVIEVVFEKSPNSKSKALSVLRQYKTKKTGKVHISVATAEQLAEFKTWLVDSSKMLNFTVANHFDKGFNKYRCETDTDKYIAILNFDEIGFSSQLLKLFDIVKKDSTQL